MAIATQDTAGTTGAGGTAGVRRVPVTQPSKYGKIPSVIGRMLGAGGGLLGNAGGAQAAGVGSAVQALSGRMAPHTAAAGGGAVSRAAPGSSTPSKPAPPIQAAPGPDAAAAASALRRVGGPRTSTPGLGGISAGSSALLSDLYAGRLA